MCLVIRSVANTILACALLAKGRIVEGPNKSDEIRAMLKADPTMPAKKVVEALAAKGVTVSLPLVNKIKYAKTDAASKAIGGKRGRPKKTKESPSVATIPEADKTAADMRNSFSVAYLFAVKESVAAFGGAERVRQALDVLEQLK